MLGDLEPPDRPVGARSQRRPDRRLGSGPGPGRRQEEDRVGDPGDEGHGPGRPAAGRQGGQRLHRLVDLALALLVPAGVGRDDRRRLQAVRRALESDPRRLQGMRRQVRARGPPDRDRLRHLHGRAGAEGGQPSPEFGFNFDPSHLLWQMVDPVRVHPGVPRSDLPRPRQGRGAGRSTAGRASSPRISTSAIRAAAGTSARPAAARSTSRRSRGA